eukprot:COSAG03_NODE_28495_length_198_cov_13.909091_1_plen_52_part_10
MLVNLKFANTLSINSVSRTPAKRWVLRHSDVLLLEDGAHGKWVVRERPVGDS